MQERRRFTDYRPHVRSTLKTVGLGLFYAVLTAFVIIGLVYVLSQDTIAENIRHREANRCQAALISDMLRDAYRVNPAYADIANTYPEINTDGIDCAPYLVQPLAPESP